MTRWLAAFALVLSPAAAAQSAWFVDVNAVGPGNGTLSSPYASIDFALAQSTTITGDSVLVFPGTYFETVSFEAKGVTVMSTDGPASTVIDAGGAGSAVSFLGTDGTVMVLDGFTITGGSGTNGATLNGGGVYGVNALLHILDCTLEFNAAERGGGLYVSNCVTEVTRCNIRNNNTTGGFYPVPAGGGVYLEGGLSWLTACMIADNVAGTSFAPGRGGGVYSSSNLAARRTVIRGNNADLGGGGFYGAGRLDVCRIRDNVAQFGGGAQVAFGALDIYDSIIDGNRADSASGTDNFGGGVYGMATLVRTTVRDNRAFGGPAGVAAGATLIDCSVLDNHATGGFGGSGELVGGASFCLLTRCTIARNTATGGGPYTARGGGAANSVLDDCLVYENSALGPNATGGGLAECTANFTAIYDNDCDGMGGGAVEGTLSRCTLVGNSAATGGDGYYVGFLKNGALLDSIAWGNGEEVLIDPLAIGTAVAYCDVEGGFIGTGNIDADPIFWDEAARDFHLQSTSPCIDAGNPASAPDPDGSRADMGAFPYDPTYTGG